MAGLEFGLGLFPTEPPRRIVETVQMAEELGYSHVWVGDSQVIWREAYVNLGAAAVATSRVTLGSGVTNPLTRHVTVTASALATLAELTSGRVVLGIGLGDSSVETVGGRPATLATLREYVQQVRALATGASVRMSDADVHIDWAGGARVPVFIGASGPNLLRLAGEVADGAIILAGTAPEYLSAAMEVVREGGRAAGRDLAAEGFRFVCWTPCAISQDGAAAREFVKAHVARVLKRPLPFDLLPEDQEVVERIYRDYEYYQHMVVGSQHGELVPDHLVPRFAVAGTPEECREQVRALVGTGVHQLAIVPHTPDPADRRSVIRSFAEDVMARL